MTDDRATFCVDDSHYLSARWPGDAYKFARAFIAKLRLAEKARARGVDSERAPNSSSPHKSVPPPGADASAR